MKTDEAALSADFLSNDALFKSILSQINEWVYVIDTSYRVVYANQSALKSIFLDENALGKTIFELFPKLTMEASVTCKSLASGVAYKNVVQTYHDVNGSKRASLTCTFPIRKGGKVIGVCEFGEDITGIVNLSDEVIKKGNLQRALQGVSVSKGDAPYYTPDDIIGESKAIKKLKQEIVQASASNSNVFITGETGTGKEMVAQSIFMLSKNYKTDPFVAQNCAAIPETLLESLLFGTVKGAFTGAESRPGLFEAVSGGIMYLDEVNSMPTSLQAKLLRVIQEGRLTRVGSTNPISVNVRIIASANAPAAKMLSRGDMRADLFYRLNVLSISIPPLRERKEDIPLLIESFIREFNRQLGKSIIGFDSPALGKMIKYSWPGNVRQLRNVVERAMNASENELITEDAIDIDYSIQYDPLNSGVGDARDGHSAPGRRVLKDEVRELERSLITEALKKFDNNVSRAARYLDLPQQTLYNKIIRLGLSERKE